MSLRKFFFFIKANNLCNLKQIKKFYSHTKHPVITILPNLIRVKEEKKWPLHSQTHSYTWRDICYSGHGIRILRLVLFELTAHYLVIMSQCLCLYPFKEILKCLVRGTTFSDTTHGFFLEFQSPCFEILITKHLN